MNKHLHVARKRLVLAYVGVFAIVLAAFAIAVSWTVTQGLRQQLDQSLRGSIGSMTDAVALATDPSAIQAALGRLRVPDRELLAMYPNGDALYPESPPVWAADVARFASASGPVFTTVEYEDHDLRVLAVPQPAAGDGAQPGASAIAWVAVAAADFVEVEDRYPALFGGFGAAAVGAMLLVGLGGSILARRSLGEAELAFDQLRRFTADAAHELRTPVSVIRAQADVTLQQPRSHAEYAEALAGIADEAGRLSGTVEKLLQLARADAGEWPTRFETVYLDDVLSDLSRSIRTLAEHRNVSLEIDLSDECPVLGDRALLQQLARILVDNALDYTPEGGSVVVRATRDAEASEFVVSDTGPGIPPELAPHVFDRFVRGDAARQRGGAGLGLSIAKWIAEVHGADLTLGSSRSGGTVATVRFPPGGARSSA